MVDMTGIERSFSNLNNVIKEKNLKNVS